MTSEVTKDRHDPPDFSAFPALTTKFPHIVQKLKVFWGYQDVYNYLAELSIQDRGNARVGFPKTVLVELQKIREYHHQWLDEPAKKDFWENSYVRT